MKLIMVLYLNTGIIVSQNLFFSEYAEGSSYNKALEIFNPANNEIVLTGYEIWKVTNSDGSWTDETENGSYPFDTDNQSKCDLMNYATLNYNGDDAIGLVYNGNLIDVIGTLGGDPGSGFEVALTSNATKDHTLVRKESVLSGNIDGDASENNSGIYFARISNNEQLLTHKIILLK